jgi:hypothetical protein
MYTFKITREIEVDSFPHYRCDSNQFWYKVLNETHCITIQYLPNGEFQSSEIKYDRIVPNNVFREGTYEIIEEEFKETYRRALILIDNKSNNHE